MNILISQLILLRIDNHTRITRSGAILMMTMMMRRRLMMMMTRRLELMSIQTIMMLLLMHHRMMMMLLLLMMMVMRCLIIVIVIETGDIEMLLSVGLGGAIRICDRRRRIQTVQMHLALRRAAAGRRRAERPLMMRADDHGAVQKRVLRHVRLRRERIEQLVRVRIVGLVGTVVIGEEERVLRNGGVGDGAVRVGVIVIGRQRGRRLRRRYYRWWWRRLLVWRAAAAVLVLGRWMV